MPIYEFSKTGISQLGEMTFAAFGLHERRDLQRLLRENIEVIAKETLIISEEFGDWEDVRRRIDLLAIDKNANLVVIELKRTEDGGHMELQAIRYASMVSTMTFDKAADVFQQYLRRTGRESEDAKATMLDFLGWDQPDDDAFAQDVRIVLASAEFSKELTSSVLWLIEHDIDICCIRLKPYSFDGRLLVDVQQIIPPPEAADYQVKIREKNRREREARTSNVDFTRFDVQIEGQRTESMWKRNAIFLVCKRLCEKGIMPEEIAKLFDWRINRVWYVVDGLESAAEFQERATLKALGGGPSFVPTRWFCEESELVRTNGKTYAFSNQWGGSSWHQAMNALKEKYPQFNIEFTPALPSAT
jgi:hypothetical protein